MSLNINRDPYSTGRTALNDLANTTGASGGPGVAAGPARGLVQQAAALVQDGVIDARATPESQATEMFQQQFGDLAQDKDAFHSMMKKVYGESYDAGKAEEYRQMALKGDYSFLPPVKFVSRETLQGGNGAYNADEGAIYLAEDLKSNPSLMQQTFVEEAGHHLDQTLNPNDSIGDEGELFRRLMSGEKLSAGDIAEIRAENDKGTIMVDGKAVEVEFWNPVKAIKKAAKAVAGAVKEVAKGVADGAKAVGDGIVGAGKSLYDGVTQGVGGFAKNLIKGNVTEAFRSLARGADKAIFGTVGNLTNGVLNGVEKAAIGATYLLGPVGKPIREEVIPRAIDVVRQANNTVLELGRDAFRLAIEAPLGFVEDLGKAAALAIKGEWGEAGKQFGKSFANLGIRVVGGVADSVMRVAQGIVDIGQTAVGLAPPSRALTDDEIALLKEVYGDSIDYSQVRVKFGGPLNADINGRARVVGGTVYFPKEDAGKALRNPDGSLTEFGETLVHEFGHVWQNQNGGGDYIHQALLGQAGDGYDYQKGINEGKSFSELNPEQQAEYLGHELAEILAKPGSAEENLRAELSGAELAYALDALNHVRAGSGTPEGVL